MTSAQIKYAIESYGFRMNTWTTLFDPSKAINIGLIGLAGDNNLVINPTTTQYYFNTADNLLYIKKYTGAPTDTQTTSNTIEVTYGGKQFYFAPQLDQIYDQSLGYIAEAVDFSTIVAFYPNIKDTVAVNY